MNRDRPDRQALSRLDLGGLIREARQIAGLSQQELAGLVGTSQSVISRWERGHDAPRVDTLARILQACGFEADIVFRRHDDEDLAQIARHAAMTPAQRARAFESAIDAFELAQRARPVGANV